MDAQLDRQWRFYEPYGSPYDPCPSLEPKRFIVPPNQYVVRQPERLAQCTPVQALSLGTLWPSLYSPYHHGDWRG